MLPITRGGGFAGRAGFAVALRQTATTGIVRCDQPGAVDMHARKAQPVETAPEDIVAEVIARLATLFQE